MTSRLSVLERGSGRTRRYVKLVVLVFAGIVIGDLAAYVLWPVLSDHPFAQRSNEDVRQSIRRSPIELPAPKRSSEYTIGVYGGSVASQLAKAWAEDWQQIEASEGLSREVGRPLRIVDFAVLSGDQPGQYNSLHLTHDRIDAAVLVDGFNEASSELINGEPGCRFMRRFWEQNQKTPEELLRLVVRKREELVSFTESWVWVPLRYSGVFKYYLFRRGVGLVAELKEYHRTLGAGVSGGQSLQAEGQAAHWVKCVRLTTEFAQMADLPTYMFLQPNLHLDGTKPYTAEEEILRQEGATGKDWLESYYAALGPQVTELRELGIPVWSLVDVFADTRETLYVDSCCHVNARGSAILAEVISRKILEDRARQAER